MRLASSGARCSIRRDGRGKEVLTGCIRKEGEVFIVVEAMVLEVLGVRVTRSPDERSGLEILTLA